MALQEAAVSVFLAKAQVVLVVVVVALVVVEVEVEAEAQPVMVVLAKIMVQVLPVVRTVAVQLILQVTALRVQALCVLFGPAQVVHSHQQIQETCNGILYSH
jgi:hypothetical protein